MSEENETQVAQPRTTVPLETPLYYTGKPVRESTVFGYIVSEVIQNPGISVGSMIETMLQNFQPDKAANFGRGYCRSYVRGSITEGYCTDEAGMHVTEITEPDKTERSAPGGGSGGLSEKARGILEMVQSSETPVLVSTISESTGRNFRSIGTTVRSLEKRGLVTVTDVMDETQERIVDRSVTATAE